MSEHAHAKKFDLLKTDLKKSLRSILAISAISTAVMVVAAFPIARVFAFEYRPTVALALVLIAMMVGLIPFSLNFMLQRVFYALEDTKSPFIFTTIQIAIFVVGAYICASQVQAMALVFAISLVMSVSFAVQALLAYLLLQRRIGSLNDLGIFRYGSEVVLAGVLAGVFGYAVLHLIGGVSENAFAVSSALNALISCVAVGGTSVAVYVGALWMAKNAEVRSVMATVKGIFRR
jgi:putative peptidoglycan lipid II flippase